jgi:predicted Zn finger-like uncharacterized protein
MTFGCERCSAKYSLEDDKIAGRTFRVRCRRCGYLVVVRPTPAPAAPEPPAPAPPPPADGRLRIRFKARTVAELVARYGDDLDTDLIFIKTRDVRPPGQTLDVLFELHDGVPWFEGRCRVLWARRADVEQPEMRSGMALEIEAISPASEPVFQEALVELAHRRLSRRSGARPSAV